MELIRYAIEHLPENSDPHHPSQKSALHAHSRRHIWLRLDENTILVMAHILPGHLEQAKVKATTLPHLHDRTPLKSVLPAEKFTALQSKYGLREDDCTADFLGTILGLGHSQFEPPI